MLIASSSNKVDSLCRSKLSSIHQTLLGLSISFNLENGSTAKTPFYDPISLYFSIQNKQLRNPEFPALYNLIFLKIY
jgi:hypothetical protein